MTEDSQTFGVHIAASYDTVYAHLRDPAHLGEWASGLGTLHREGMQWVTNTPEGVMPVRFSPPNEFGVLDHWVQPAKAPEVYIPLRLLRHGTGCELILTLFRQPDMDDAKLAADGEWIQRDLKKAKEVLEALPG